VILGSKCASEENRSPHVAETAKDDYESTSWIYILDRTVSIKVT
jgi:hypothetical protein